MAILITCRRDATRRDPGTTSGTGFAIMTGIEPKGRESGSGTNVMKSCSCGNEPRTIDGGAGAPPYRIPFLCVEACNLFVAEARKIVKVYSK